MTRNDHQVGTSPAATRMRRLRERRRNATRVVAVELGAADVAYLRLRGFLHEGEAGRPHLVRALQRLLKAIR